jgi:hypothetical protein
MKRDKSLGILLMVLFGISSITILVLAWLWPMSGLERILATFIGVSGLLVALSRVSLLKSTKAKTDVSQVMVQVEVQDKS